MTEEALSCSLRYAAADRVGGHRLLRAFVERHVREVGGLERITMGCGETCPLHIGARYADWELYDPKGQDESTVRRIVAEIDQRVRRAPVTLTGAYR